MMMIMINELMLMWPVVVSYCSSHYSVRSCFSQLSDYLSDWLWPWPLAANRVKLTTRIRMLLQLTYPFCCCTQ